MNPFNTFNTVFVSGNFNVIHPGHLRLLRFAKECGARLVVAVQSDKLAGNAAHVPELKRLDGVLSLSYVDKAFIIHEPVVEVIKQLRPDAVIKGSEHLGKSNPEAEVLENYGGKLLFSSGESSFSSIDLIKREFKQTNLDKFHLPFDYLERRGIHKARLFQLCKRFNELKVAVIGDLIIDEYITCHPIGMSQEDPTIVVTPLDSQRFIGGAGIVAAHAAGLGARTDFVSVSGGDMARAFAIERLAEFKVRTQLIQDISRPTTLKQRFRSKGKTLLRVSHLHQNAISEDLQQEALNLIAPVLNEVDLLVFSDFNYGCLPQNLVERITSMAKKHGVFLAADSQSSSQVGDVSRFNGMDLITPTEWEARLATRNQSAGLVVVAEELRKRAAARSVLLKLGEEGLLVHTCDVSEGQFLLTDQIPALNTNPKDVVGAGDSLLIVCAMAMTAGANVWEASLLGSFAAAIQIGRVGNSPLGIEELVDKIQASI